MPCTKCEEGKYKWGKTGECEYDSLDACESANSKYSKMKPTPLGKKTYEEYEKELKEFNLSEVERIELSLAQDLNKSTKALSALMKKYRSLSEDVSQSSSSVYLETEDLWQEWKGMKQKAQALGSENKSVNNDFGKLMVLTAEMKSEISTTVRYIEEVEKSTKELGINPRDMSGYGEAVDITVMTSKMANETSNNKRISDSINVVQEMIKDIG
jgi:hypothetical protein